MSRMALHVPWLLAFGCISTAGDVRTPRTHTGEADEHDPNQQDEDTDPEDTGGDTGDTGDTGVLPAAEACYLGADRSFTTCLAVHTVDPGSDYDYPDALSGDPNYRPPIAWLDLDALDPSTALAPNFVLDEVAQAWKGRYAVVQPHAIDRLQDLRDELGALVVNSGYRSPAYNAGVGGATSSRHQYGDAFDLDPVHATLSELAAACEAQGAGYVGWYETHIHCDWRRDDVDEIFFGPAGRSAATADHPVLDARILRAADGALQAPAEGWDEGEPLREWVARDTAGRILAESTGRTFYPPPASVSVEVRVGGTITRTIDL